MAVMMKRDAASGAKGSPMAQQAVQRSAQKSALRGMDFAAGEAALSPNVQMKGEEEKGETETESPDLEGGPKLVGKHAMVTPAGKLTNVVVSGYPKGDVEVRETKGSRVIIECSNTFTGTGTSLPGGIGASPTKTVELLDGKLGALVDDQSAANGTMTISRHDGYIKRIVAQLGDITIDQKIVVYVPVGTTATVQ